MIRYTSDDDYLYGGGTELKRGSVAALVVALGMSFVACGGGGMSGGHEGHAGMNDDAAKGGMVPGAPAEASEATRKIEVAALDQLRFDPASLEVGAGDVVTFVVTNKGDTNHEFVLGNASYQEAHGGAMEHDMTMGNAVLVPPGETKKLTWRFDEPGEVLYGCHVAGHYDGGMVGTIDVT